MEEWVHHGRTDQLPEGMDRYLEQLNFVNSLWNSCHSPQKIISKLIITYPELDRISAKSRFEEAVTWFYLDDKVKQDAYRNMIFQKQLQLVDATILSAKSSTDYNIASLILERARLAKGLDRQEEPKIPESAFSKPIKIYSLNPSDFADLPQSTNRNTLAQYVDEMNLTEDQKLKIKQDMGVEPRELFEFNGKEEDGK